MSGATGVSRDQVRLAYELMLGRPPENEAAIVLHCRLPDLQTLGLTLAQSPEFASRMRALAPATPAPPDLAATLQAIDARLGRLESFATSGRVTYMGDGRVLLRADIHGMQIAYLLEARDLLLVPWFIVSGLFETEHTAYFCRTVRPDDFCIDIGANFGYYTCLFGRIAQQGRVIGVEPDTHVFNLLRDNVHINALQANTAARQNAVCDAETALTLHRRVGRSGNTSIWNAPAAFTELHGEPPAVPFVVQGTTVDRLVEAFEGRLDIMKLDVEGAEPLVFQGIGRTVAANPGLQIVMEWSPGQMATAGLDAAGMLDRIAALGLSVFDLDAAHTPLGRDTLLGLVYAPGVLITRQPR